MLAISRSSFASSIKRVPRTLLLTRCRTLPVRSLSMSASVGALWLERDDLISASQKFPQLEQDLQTDVLVVGGGIAGLHIAYELLSSGQKKVALIEDGRAQQSAIERIASIVEKHKIDCDFVRLPGYMFQGLPKSDKDFELDTLKSLFEAAFDTKQLDVKIVDDAQIKGFASGPAIKFGNQATFHPTKYVRALADVVKEMGGEIYEKTRYMSHVEEDGGVTSTLANDKKVRSGSMVMATNVPLQKPYRTYAVALKIPTSAVSSSGENALWWDLADPYHYIRVTPHKQEGYSLLVVGGEDEKVGQHDDYDERYQRLEQWTRERWAEAGEVEYKWSAGDNGDGLTYAAIGGMIISDLILGKENPLAHTFSPSRQHSGSHIKQMLKTIPSMIKDNLSDQIYYTKWATTCTKTITDIEDLVPGEGDVVREGLSPIAVYKDEGGQGIVAWNKDEKSFDCPIHGSRFTCKGQVINGPAKAPLQAK
ncbi:hypothetical protein IAU60_004915 [Kwoniella sp. DSM 27419]